MSNSWELEMEKRMHNFQCVDFFPHLHPSSCSLYFSQVWPLGSFSVCQCHHAGSSWLSSLLGTPPPMETVFRWQLSSQCLHLLPRWVEPDRPLGGRRGQGKEEGRRSGQGMDWRSSGRLGGEKLNKQGSRCLKSFWLLLKQLFTLHGEVRGGFHRPLLVGGSAAIDAFVLFCDSFNKQRAASWS